MEWEGTGEEVGVAVFESSLAGACTQCCLTIYAYFKLPRAYTQCYLRHTIHACFDLPEACTQCCLRLTNHACFELPGQDHRHTGRIADGKTSKNCM
jgi:hypothetical protein